MIQMTQMRKTFKVFVLALTLALLLQLLLPAAFIHAADSDEPVVLEAGISHVAGVPYPQQKTPEFVTYVNRDELPESARDFTRIRVMSSSVPIDMSGNGVHKYTNFSESLRIPYGSSVPFEGKVYILTILYDDNEKPLGYQLASMNLTLNGGGSTGGSTGGSSSSFGQVDHLEANERDIVLTSGQTRKIRIYAIDTNGIEKEVTNDKKTTYRSDSASIADVSAGVIKAGKREGTANITANYGGKKVVIPVQVAKTTITQLKPSVKTLTLEAGELEQLKLNAVLSDGTVRDVSSLAVWITDNSSVADVEAGEVEAVDQGNATITAFYNGMSVDIAVEVEPEYSEESLFEVVGLETSNKNIKMKANEEKLLLIYAVYDDGSKEEVTDSVLWQTSKSDVVEVEEGILIAGKSGKAIVTATFENHSIQVSVEVAKQKAVKSLTASTKSATIKRGNEKELSLSALFVDGTKADVTEDAVWTSRDDNIAEVDAGTVTANKKGSTVITAKYNGKLVNIIVKVN